MGSLIKSLKLWKSFLRVKSATHRSIMTSTPTTEKALEKLKSNPFFDKYSQKIASVHQTAPEKLLACLEEAKPDAPLPDSKEHECFMSASTQPKFDISSAYAKPKSLNDIMKTDLLVDKSKTEIEQIWHEYYKHKEGLAAVIPADIYKSLCDRGKEYPLFLLPLPRSNGYEFIVLQFAGHEVHFTQLINYQAHKENSPECLTLHHYTELMDSKHIVLMRGEFDKNVLGANEAQCLVNQLQLYYGKPDHRRLNLLEKFTRSTSEFKHMDLVAELECLSL